MSKKHYFEPEDLKKFGNIGEWQKPMADKFFDYYGEVFKEGALSEREKALIALAVAHTVQCPYCIDAYTTDTLEKGCSEDEMMEAVHVGAVMAAGITLVHSTQMINKAKEFSTAPLLQTFGLDNLERSIRRAFIESEEGRTVLLGQISFDLRVQ